MSAGAAVLFSALLPALFLESGPAAESRFPPLRLPPGFRATLFACDPLIEYPSAVAAGPRAGAVFVAVDYLTGLGTEITRRDEVRLLEDLDGDGYADRSTVYAGGLNSIQGLAFHGNTLYAMHAPFLTALPDADGDGRADGRRDLLRGLGPTPEENPVRLHAANGVAVGHDGWLYLALGDHGCEVLRPEGDRLVLKGGGILRARPDGRGLHVFATGLRNIYDVALDEELNVFVRDNENDGGEYKVRVCHSFFGADHGYPYLFQERPREALEPLADLGLGSSAGGLVYREAAFPAEYRGNLFFCEWGRAVMRCRPRPAGSAFAPLEEIEFASGAENDPYGFKPTDLAVLADGSLIVADWADGQRPRRGRGRIYRIAWGAAPAELPTSGEIERRGRLHGVWALARAGGESALTRLLHLAGTDLDPGVRVQAVRAAADLSDPVLIRDRLDAGPGDAAVAEGLAGLLSGGEPRVLREALVALGRLRFRDTPRRLVGLLSRPDPALEHAAMQALRRSEDWPALLDLLDGPRESPVRSVAFRAVSGLAVPALVDGLLDRLRSEPDPARRREYADALARVSRKSGPQPYWGYRPAPRPPGSVDWERTGAIEEALDRALADPDPAVRGEVFRRMHREKIPVSDGRLLDLAGSLEDGPALADALREASKRPGVKASPLGPPLILGKLGSPDREVRLAALEAAAELGMLGAGGAADNALRDLLQDREPSVRAAAASAAGRRGLRVALAPLLRLARDPESAVRRASFDALRLLGEPAAVPLALGALADGEVRSSALECLGELAGPEAAEAVVDLAKRSPSADLLTVVGRMLSRWMDRDEAKRPELERALAGVQGETGVLFLWRTTVSEGEPRERTLIGAGVESPLRLDPAGPEGKGGVWLARSDVSVAEETPAQFLGGSSGSLEVRLNGRVVYRRDEPRAFRIDSDRFEGLLERGTNRLVVQVASPDGAAELQLRFRRKSSTAERESLTQALLAGTGEAERGRRLFFDAGKLPCGRCHSLGGQGERLGPELTGIGRRFSRVHLIEAILEPGRAIAPGFETTVVALKDGRVLAGIKAGEDAETLTLGDSEGRRNSIPRSAIRDQRLEALSIMPEGLEKQLTTQEFLDLIAFLAGQR